MRIQSVPIGKLQAAAYNPRKDLRPGDPEYEQLRRSIESFGLVEPLVWNERSGHLVGGHQRLKILLAQGVREVEVSVVNLDAQRERALNLALNKIAGDWDTDKLRALLRELDAGDCDLEVTGFTPEEVADLLAQLDDGQEREQFDLAQALEAMGPPRIQPGEVWHLGKHRLSCGDSTDPETWCRLLGSSKVDLVVTSPPYNVGVKYASYRDQRARADYLDFLRQVGQHLVAHLAPGRCVAWNIGVSPDSYPHYHVVVLEECGLQFCRQIVWEKAGVPYPIFPSTLKAKRARHYKPNYKHEMIYLLQQPDAGAPDLPLTVCPVCDGGGQVRGMPMAETYGLVVLMGNGQPELGGNIQPVRKYANDIWRIMQAQATTDLPTLGTRSTGLVRRGKKTHMIKAHPAAFPVELPRALLTFLTAAGEAVLDPFAGAGATLMAAEQLGRVGYGIELEPRYCELIIMRWEAATGQQAWRADEAGGGPA